MSHRTEAKSYNIYAVYNNGEPMKTLVVHTLLNSVPPTIHDDTYGVEAVAQVEVEFEFEEVK